MYKDMHTYVHYSRDTLYLCNSCDASKFGNKSCIALKITGEASCNGIPVGPKN